MTLLHEGESIGIDLYCNVCKILEGIVCSKEWFAMLDTLSLEDQVIGALRRITRAIDLHSRALVQQHGLTVPQLATLRAVANRQPVTASGLAKAIHLSLATVTGILDRLEKRGLVARSRDGHDRRSVVVQLTEAGAKLVESERTQLLASLQRIAAMMDAERIEAVPVLSTGVVTASPENISHYLERAVRPTDAPPPDRSGSELAGGLSAMRQ
jgi:DNA-binding MarR family transcriptional regulator